MKYPDFPLLSEEDEKRDKVHWDAEKKYHEAKMAGEEIESIDTRLYSDKRKVLSPEAIRVIKEAWNIERLAYKRFNDAFNDWIMDRISKADFQKIQAEWNHSYKELQKLKAEHGDL